MEKLSTKYGELTAVSYIETYPDGNIRGCVVTEKNEIETMYGVMVPQYLNDEERRKHINSLKFHHNGNLQSISLHEQTQIETPLGTFPAEYITFYEDGSLRSIFPLNGKLSGYWTEEKEYALAEEFTFNFPFGQFTQKIISIKFYQNGAVRSITFWPKDCVKIQSPLGEVWVQIGLELYPNGQLKSFEPYDAMLVDTPIGKILAYDQDALGIHGDSNSIRFYEDGTLASIITSTDKIEVTDKDGNKKEYQPSLIPNWCNESIMQPVPMVIEFIDNKARFNKSCKDEYDIKEYNFKIETIYDISSTCGSCSDCG